MKLIDMLSQQLAERLNRRCLGGYLRVALVPPWANLEEAVAQVDVDELSTEAVRAFLVLPEGGEKEASTYNDTNGVLRRVLANGEILFDHRRKE
jgi:hypothetical protein